MTPTTFKEYLKLLYARFLLAAGVATGLGIVGIVLLLVYGRWPEKYYGDIIAVLGKLALGGGMLMTLIVIFQGLGGAAQRIKASIWGAAIETESDNDCA